MGRGSCRPELHRSPVTPAGQAGPSPALAGEAAYCTLPV